MPVMRGVRAARIVAALGLTLSFGILVGSGASAEIPRDEAALTAAMAEKLTAALPKAKVSVAGPLLLAMTGIGAFAESRVDLHRLWDFCVRNPGRCDEAMDDHAVKVAAAINQFDEKLDLSRVRMALRPAGYVAAIRRQFAGQPEAEPLAVPFYGDLWAVLAIDTPDSARLLSRRDLKVNDVTLQQALDASLKNVEATLHPLPAAGRLPPDGIGMIEGDYYESSRLLLHDSWKGLAASFKGPLLVAAPDPRVVLYADGGVPKMRATLARRANEAAKKSDRPLSTTVFQWSAEGWKPVRR